MSPLPLCYILCPSQHTSTHHAQKVICIIAAQHKMAFEVNEEPLPAGWEVLMSRSQNMPYYSNVRTKKVYWVDDELPRGWSHQFDDQKRRYYFHIRDKQATISYDKPVLRRAPLAVSLDEPPLPALPEPSYDPQPQTASRMERKKSNSLMDLLSPGPPALGADERSPGTHLIFHLILCRLRT